MKFFSFCFLFSFVSSVLSASEIAEVLLDFKEPSMEQAKSLLEELDVLIANGDARTVTLSKKIHRSVKRIFTAEFQILAAEKVAGEKETKAKQLYSNAKKWLKPNTHGVTNKNASDAALRQARKIRREISESQADFSKKWAEETADFEKMLGDLEFSKEIESLHALGGALNALVKRISWVDRPTLRYDKERIAFLKELGENRDTWETLAKHAVAAGDLDLGYDLYRKTGNQLAKFQVGARLAGRLVEEGFPGSAKNLWERIGELEKASELEQQHSQLGATAFRPLDDSALLRQAAPACVRVLIPGGYRTGFFYKPGGHLLTCKKDLLNKEGKLHALTVVLEDGRKFPAKVVGLSEKEDFMALQIDLKVHELLPLGDQSDLEVGGDVTLLGFRKVKENFVTPVRGSVMAALELWEGQSTMRLAMDALDGQRGGPLLDGRGRVLGLFLSSATGRARAVEISALKGFLEEL